MYLTILKKQGDIPNTRTLFTLQDNFNAIHQFSKPCENICIIVNEHHVTFHWGNLSLSVTHKNNQIG